MQESFRRIAISGAFVTGASQIVRFVVQGASIVVLARLLTPGDFGLTAMVFPIIAFATMLQEAGLGAALIQRETVSRAELGTLFWFNTLIGLALAAILVGVAPLVADFYREPRVAALTAASGGLVLLAALGAQPVALMNREMRYASMALIEAVAIVIGFIVAVLVAALYESYWAIWLMPFTTTLVSLVMGWGLSGRPPTKIAPPAKVFDMVAFGGHLTLSAMFTYLGRNLDKVLIGRVWGGEPLGFYDRAYKLLMLPLLLVNSPIQRLIVPMLTRTRTDEGRYRHIYFSALELALLATVPAVTLCVAAPDEAVRVILGPEWGGAAAIFAWLGIATLVQLVTNSFGWLYISQGRARDMMVAGVTSSLYACGAFLIGLQWGAVGVAAAYAIGEVIRTPVVSWWVTRKGPVRPADLFRACMPFMLAALASALAVLALKSWRPWGAIEFMIVGGLLSYAATVAVLMLTARGRACIANAVSIGRSALAMRTRRLAQSGT